MAATAIQTYFLNKSVLRKAVDIKKKKKKTFLPENSILVTNNS